MLARARALNDDRVDGWLLQGQVHTMLRHPGEALADYESALLRTPLNVEALRGRVLALAELQRRDEARAALDEGLRLVPADATLIQLRDQLTR
jgi:Flp pilus assembly protein TadD